MIAKYVNLVDCWKIFMNTNNGDLMQLIFIVLSCLLSLITFIFILIKLKNNNISDLEIKIEDTFKLLYPIHWHLFWHSSIRKSSISRVISKEVPLVSWTSR